MHIYIYKIDREEELRKYYMESGQELSIFGCTDFHTVVSNFAVALFFGQNTLFSLSHERKWEEYCMPIKKREIKGKLGGFVGNLIIAYRTPFTDFLVVQCVYLKLSMTVHKS